MTSKNVLARLTAADLSAPAVRGPSGQVLPRSQPLASGAVVCGGAGGLDGAIDPPCDS